MPPTPQQCPQCGTRMEGGRPDTVCIKCLLSLGLKTATLADEEEAGGTPEDSMASVGGDSFDRFRIVEKIGEGGCGIVYRALQLQPVRREVALKVIKLGMDSRSVVARFDAERQTLALMDHPGIARVFDAGLSRGGRPFFAMELVTGEPVTAYCDRKRLSVAERLKLFASVCEAVQHAHHKGIIHRDLKPSNILVGESDGVAQPKVIDFGIAKATSRQRLADQTLYTAFDQFIGTPAYMSPEQTGATGGDVDTRSDIYSLGVLLYELLTGVPPFDPHRLQGAAVDEILRIIREEEPVRPSERIRRLAMSAGAERTAIIRHVPGDLDWIVMTALEKTPARRYGTASEFAQDLLRHLGSEPVRARPPSRLYRLQKAVWRNRLAYASGAVVALALMTATGVSMWRLKLEGAARREAEQVKREAEAHALRSDQVARFLREMLAGVSPAVAMGQDTTLLRQLLDQAAGRLGTELAGQPEVEAELRATIGTVYSDLFELSQAETMHREALRLRESVLGPDHERVADSLCDLVRVLNTRARPEDLAEAEHLARRALALRRRTLGEEHPKVADALQLLGWNCWARNRNAEAEALFRESLALRRRLLGAGHLDTTLLLNSLALVLEEREDTIAEAESLMREALAVQLQLLDPEHPILMESHGVLGGILRELGKNDPAKSAEAETHIRRSIALRKKHLGPENPSLGDKLNLLAGNLCDQGKFAEAEAAIREAMAIETKLHGPEHYRFAKRFLGTLTKIYHLQQRWAEAESTVRDWIALCRKLEVDREVMLGALHWQSNVLIAQDRWEEAEGVLRERLALCEIGVVDASSPEAVRVFQVRRFLGEALRRNGNYAEAEAMLRSSYEGLKDRTGRWEWQEACNSAHHLALLCEATGRPDEAAAWRQKGAELIRARAVAPAEPQQP